MFECGDRVVLIVDEDIDGLLIQGQVGTVCDVGNDRIGVRWDDEMERAHVCGGTCDDKHGWYVDEDEIELITEEFDMDDSDVQELLEICAKWD